MVIGEICKTSVCNNYILNNLYVLCSHNSQPNVLLYDYCISLCMSFTKIKSIVFNHFHVMHNLYRLSLCFFVFYIFVIITFSRV